MNETIKWKETVNETIKWKETVNETINLVKRDSE